MVSAGPSSPKASSLTCRSHCGVGVGGPGSSHTPETAAPWLTWEAPTSLGASISAPGCLLLPPGSAGWCVRSLLLQLAEGEPKSVQSRGAFPGSHGLASADAPSVKASHTQEARVRAGRPREGPHLEPDRPWTPSPAQTSEAIKVKQREARV